MLRKPLSVALCANQLLPMFRVTVCPSASVPVYQPLADTLPRDYSSPNAGIMQDGTQQPHIKMSCPLQTAITVKKMAGCTAEEKPSAATAAYQAIGSLNKAIKYILERRVKQRRFPNRIIVPCHWSTISADTQGKHYM